MTFIITRSGVRFDVANPRPEDVRLDDIAHALSHLCRFVGHTDRFYSVAEHSVLVSQLCDDETAVLGLLHDAAEAYVGDLASPVKRQVPGFAVMEERVLSAVLVGLGVPPPTAALRARVANADAVALGAEAARVAPPVAELPSEMIHKCRALKGRWGLSPLDARAAFMDRAFSLGIEGAR